MSITNPSVGLQLDADTLALFKSHREFDQALGILPAGVYNQTDGIADNTGNYPLSGFSSPQISNGPLGAGGWNRAVPQFSRSFGSSAAGYVDGGLMDQASNDACRVDFTNQIMFRHQWADTAARGLFGWQNVPAAGTANDWVDRVFLSSAGFPTAWWESNDANFSLVGTEAAQKGKWQVLTIVWEPAATGYDIRIYMHTLDSPGVVTGGLTDTGLDVGVLPLAASGVGDSRLQYGCSTRNTPNLIGQIAFGRFYKGIVADIDGEARELLLTGTLAADDSNDHMRHEFNEAPEWVDEGPIGYHGQGGMLVDRGVSLKHIDLIGSGGRSRRNADSAITLRELGHGAEAQVLFPASLTGERLSSLFNTAVKSVPEYTLQWWCLRPSQGSVLFAQWTASSETEATNILIQFGITDTILTNFSERGGGTNNVILSTVGVWDGTFDGGLDELPLLVTIRSDELGSAPGEQRLRLSINDDIDLVTLQMNFPPTGGTSSTGLVLRSTDPGRIQEMKVSVAVISDQQIIDDAARCLDREGGLSAPLPPVIPPLSSLEADADNGGMSFALRED